VTALEAGYRVRAPVRSISKTEPIKAAPSVQKYLNKLEFVIVPDIINEGAFDDAVKGVDCIIHCASPLALEVSFRQTCSKATKATSKYPFQTDNYERDIIVPSVKGTVGILASAAKEPTVKRIVMTSSEVAIIPLLDLVARVSDTVFDCESFRSTSKLLLTLKIQTNQQLKQITGLTETTSKPMQPPRPSRSMLQTTSSPKQSQVLTS
jgi:nucleoside-diphosphate-sugar epimerase